MSRLNCAVACNRQHPQDEYEVKSQIRVQTELSQRDHSSSGDRKLDLLTYLRERSSFSPLDNYWASLGDERKLNPRERPRLAFPYKTLPP